jgi:Uma2 family endonuclease
MLTKQRATIEDLYRVEGKAEIVNGEIVLHDATGDEPARASGSIYVSLREYERRTHAGYAYPDNAGFHVYLPNRESFSPDAAFYTGQRMGMKFLEGAPVFAVEVRSESDYGPKEEQEMADKRADYFAAGTRVVWDVDLLDTDLIRKYSHTDPQNPTRFQRGGIADAEPAVPGWTFAVDDLFD